jgi:HPt (histidine-containing phosphotransfer) domain-containing protein
VAFDYADAIKSEDQDVVDIISDVFIAQWPVDAAKMASALASGDFDAVMHVAHTLKGTLGMFGAQPAVSLATDLEQLALACSGASSTELTATLAAKVADLEVQMDYLLNVLKSRCA